jgi:hypothetical protein
MQLKVDFLGEATSNTLNYSMYSYLSKVIPDFHESSDWSVVFASSIGAGGSIFGTYKKPFSIYVRCLDKLKLLEAGELLASSDIKFFNMELVNVSIEQLSCVGKLANFQLVLKEGQSLTEELIRKKISAYDLKLGSFKTLESKTFLLKLGSPPITSHKVSIELFGSTLEKYSFMEGGIGKNKKFGFGSPKYLI